MSKLKLRAAPTTRNLLQTFPEKVMEKEPSSPGRFPRRYSGERRGSGDVRRLSDLRSEDGMMSTSSMGFVGDRLTETLRELEKCRRELAESQSQVKELTGKLKDTTSSCGESSLS
mmetsp:Transcript_44375/g.81213  ORF Transcript_44375/g.81213 Transcript_44375/m.81213 type:complete len:115 (-) Transcript_44375:18-362(-)